MDYKGKRRRRRNQYITAGMMKGGLQDAMYSEGKAPDAGGKTR
ncbi:MAG: hypothetical protein QG646_800 [Euryarchaeota archaeon]|nr:hypothetical protein [Euryarchaeota archaeon]